MNKVYNRINWANYPNQSTPLNESNLNKMDSALFTIDDRVCDFDVTKAEQSDLLDSLKNVNYDSATGLFTFTWHNGTVLTVDLNIEKIPVSFSMDAKGIIKMRTEDGSEYTADVGALIKEYAFDDSSVIDFTVTVDSDGVRRVSADIIDGSIEGKKLEPNYLANCVTAADNASASATNAKTSEDNAKISETNAKASEVKAKEYMEEAKQTDVSELSETIANQQNEGFLRGNLIDYAPTMITLHKTNSRTYRLYLKNKIELKSGKEYTISIDDLVTSNVTKKVGCNVVKEDGTNLVALDIDINDKKVTFNATEDISIISLYLYLKSNDTDNAQATFSKIMMSEGSVATPYTPYALSNVALTDKVVRSEEEGYLLKNLYDGTYTLGINTSGEKYSNRAMSSAIPLDGIAYIRTVKNPKGMKITTFSYDSTTISSGTKLIDWTTDTNKHQIEVSNKYIRFCFQNASNNALTESDFDGLEIEVYTTLSNSELTKAKATIFDGGYASKNLLKLNASSTTSNGITYTVNSDGTVKVNGTATETSVLSLTPNLTVDKPFKVCGCPSGGSTSKYAMTIKVNGAWGNNDIGNGWVSSASGVVENINIAIYKGTTVNNLVFKPMVTTDLEATYDDYQEYVSSNKTLSDEIANIGVYRKFLYSTAINLTNEYQDITLSRNINSNEFGFLAFKDGWNYVSVVPIISASNSGVIYSPQNEKMFSYMLRNVSDKAYQIKVNEPLKSGSTLSLVSVYVLSARE